MFYFTIWATVSSQSYFGWLYRASPSLAAKTIINLIFVLTIWWCPCVESSFVFLKKVFAMTSAFSWQNSVSLWSASFCTPMPNLPVTPGVSWLPIFAFQSLMATYSNILAWKILWTVEPEGLLSIGSHRVWHNWSALACMTALEKEMATHSNILAWRIPGTEQPGGLPSVGSHRVKHDWSDAAALIMNRTSVWGVSSRRSCRSSWKWSRSVLSNFLRPHGL